MYQLRASIMIFVVGINNLHTKKVTERPERTFEKQKICLLRGRILIARKFEHAIQFLIYKF